MKNKIFMVGFMGSGKSTKGKQLAAKLECDFIDIDHEIVTKTGMSITDYFAKYGENKFRELESELLKTINYPDKCVVATGGGLPCFFDNMEWMLKKGTVIYLQMKPKELLARLHNRNKRPLIKDMDDETLLAFIEQRLKDREPFYTKATHTFNGFDLSVDTIIDETKDL